jgi:hypothetical protein
MGWCVVVACLLAGGAFAQDESPEELDAVEEQPAEEEPPAPAEGPAAAPQELPEQEKDRANVLNAHRFTRSRLVGWPFATTAFAAETLFGSYAVKRWPSSRLYRNLGGPRVYTLQGVLLSETFQLEVAVTGWLALRGTLSGTVDMPTNRDTALDWGIDSYVDRAAGASVRLAGNNSWVLSTGLDFGTYNIINVAMANYLSSVLASAKRGKAKLDADQLILTGRGWALSPAMRVAWAPTAVLGVQAQAGYELASIQGNSFIDSALALDLNLASVKVPIGIPVAFGYRRYSGVGESTLESGLFYTGRDELELGVSGEYGLNGGYNSMLAGLRLGYVW